MLVFGMDASLDSPLPYVDRKPVGSADFYFAINATFHFIARTLGKEALKRYWHDLGTHYYAPVTAQWKASGLSAVAAYWRAFFNAEPGAEVMVETDSDAVVIKVVTCPIIKHLRDHQRALTPDFCEHCYYVSESMAQPANLCVRVEGGNGRCVQRFSRVSLPPQDFQTITRCT